MSIASAHARVARPASALPTAHRPLPLFLDHHHHHHDHHRRISTTFSPRRPSKTGEGPIQYLAATRTLPYSAKKCYELIADIDAYRHFVPYCISSRVTSVSGVEERVSQRRWPRTAELTVGYGPYREVFRSRIFCAPYRVLEAVAGAAETQIPPEDLQHYDLREADGIGGHGQDGGRGEVEKKEEEEEVNKRLDTVFTRLSTRWKFEECGMGESDDAGAAAGSENGETAAASQQVRQSGAVSTQVTLSLRAVFRSPMYAVFSKAASPKVAGVMIEAFERRARDVYGPAS